MLYSWAAFWLTYYIMGSLMYNDNDTYITKYVTIKQLLNNLATHSIITLLFVPIANCIPTLIVVPDTLCGYLLRILFALLIGDLCFYSMHRLFHNNYLYKYHKIHHNYIIPHSLAGLHAHFIEMLCVNHFSMILPLKIISSHSTTMLMIESGLVALSILISHSGKNNHLTGSVLHNKHHKKLNCNYGFLYITDYIFGTLK